MPSPHQYAHRVISAYIKKIDHHQKGVRSKNSVDDLHQLRTTSRRLRNALWIFKKIFPSKELNKWKQGVRALARASNENRDVDIHICFLNDLKKKIRDDALRNQLQPLLKAFKARRGRSQKVVLDILSRIEREKIFIEIERFVATDPTIRYGHVPSLAVIARRKILKRLARLLSLAPFVHQPDKIKELHRMRIAAKHLRYTLESFEPYYGKGLKRFTVSAMKVQRVLGEVHDSDVWIAEVAAHLKKRTFVRSYPLLAFLKKECHQRREISYRKFVSLWDGQIAEGEWVKLKKLVQDS